MSNPEFDQFFKLLLVGDSGVGKSSLLLRFTNDEFTDNYVTTIGLDFKIRTITVEGKKIKLQIWDTAGQERFRTITSNYYRGAQGVLIVYDITSKLSFINLTQWIKDVEKNGSENVQKIIVGNKSDLEDAREVEFHRAKEFAESQKINIMECSAKTAANLDETFISIVNILLLNSNDSDAPKVKVIEIDRNPKIGKKGSGGCKC